ncbi:MAG: WD40 repeat domain-containing protein [Planctomycetia bacterium]|nr:WD40 repeat domain-containing protein [Planctomycetia bacterium]
MKYLDQHLVLSMVGSPDRKQLATLNADGTIRLWDAESGSCVWAHRLEAARATAGVFLDTSRIAAGSSRGDVQILDSRRSVVDKVILSPGEAVSSLTVRVGEKELIIGYWSGLIRVVSMDTWDVIRSRVVGDGGSLRSICVSPDEARLAAAVGDDLVLLDPKDLSETCRRRVKIASCLAFSSSSELVACSGGLGDLGIMKCESGAIQTASVGATVQLTSVMFTDEDRTLRVAGFDGRLYDFDVKSLAMRHASVVSSGGILALLPATKSGFAWICRGQRFDLIDLSTGTMVGPDLRNPSLVTSLGFSKDGKRLLTGFWDEVRLWDVSAKSELARFGGFRQGTTVPNGWPESESILAVSGSGACRTWSPLSRQSTEGSLGTGTWRLLASNPLQPGLALVAGEAGLGLHYPGENSRLELNSTAVPGPKLVSLDASGTRAAVSEGGRTVRLVDLSNGSVVKSAQAPGEAVRSIQFLGTENTVALLAWNGVVRLWNLDSETVQFTLDVRGSVRACIAVTADGQWIASGCANGSIEIWDLKERRLAATLEGHLDSVSSIAFDPGGTVLASGSRDSTIVLWDMSRIASDSRRK